MIEKLDAHHHFWSVGSAHYPMMNAPDTDRYIGNTGRHLATNAAVSRAGKAAAISSALAP